jgi:hypothetical protein
MPHRLLACTATEDTRSYPMAMSFSFSESLPSVDWSPPDATLLYEMSQSPSHGKTLKLPTPCVEWAETERLGL